jgi:hypothetical protein
MIRFRLTAKERWPRSSAISATSAISSATSDPAAPWQCRRWYAHRRRVIHPVADDGHHRLAAKGLDMAVSPCALAIATPSATRSGNDGDAAPKFGGRQSANRCRARVIFAHLFSSVAAELRRSMVEAPGRCHSRRWPYPAGSALPRP